MNDPLTGLKIHVTKWLYTWHCMHVNGLGVGCLCFGKYWGFATLTMLDTFSPDLKFKHLGDG